jgi:phosphohistidine swiveling domain-containing protein
VIEKQRRDLTQIVARARRVGLKKKITFDDFDQIFRYARPLLISAHFPIIAGEILDQELERVFSRYTSIDRDRLNVIAKSPTHQTVQQQYMKAVRTENFRAVYQKYPWIKSYFMEVRPFTKAMFEADKKASFVKPRSPRVTMDLDNKTDALMALSRLMTWYRDFRLFEINAYFFYLRPAFLRYGSSLGLAYDELRQLSFQEFRTGVFSKNDIKKRNDEFGILMEQGNISVCTGAKLTQLKRTVPVASSDAKKILHGHIAFKGRAVGKARVASPYTFHKIKRGEVLVTAETTPEAVPFIRNVKAIVTNEGGITSHAAIISRELGIPCIIGTKIATRVFKDGDVVEVNANHGWVRKLR